MTMPFRMFYRETMESTEEHFCVHVIGYRQVFDHIVDVPQGTPCHFVHIFHDEVDVGTREGIRPVPKGTVLVFEPHTALYLGRSKAGWCHSWLRCSGTEVQAILAEHGIPGHAPLLFRDTEENEHWLLQIYREMQHPLGADIANAEDLFRIWMRSAARSARPLATPAIPAPYMRAKHLIERNYLRPLSLQTIAAEVHVSPSHLCKAFRRHFRTAPIAYAIDLRIRHAVDLLEHETLNVTEIARRSGYDDVHYFSRMFKRHVGLSPREFRRRLQEPDGYPELAWHTP